MMRVGLTGGIGSGKTLIANRLRELGCFVLHADHLGHQVLTIPHLAYFQTVALFGTEILADDHSIDRKKLGAIVFSQEPKLVMLNQIVHPAVRQLCATLVAAANPDIFVYEVSLLFETNLQDEFDYIVAADAPAPVRLLRAMRRDSATSDQIMRRMAKQFPLDHSKLDCVIDTDCSIEETVAAVDMLYKALLLVNENV
jgi:dephospho-CoA kinase